MSRRKNQEEPEVEPVEAHEESQDTAEPAEAAVAEEPLEEESAVEEEPQVAPVEPVYLPGLKLVDMTYLGTSRYFNDRVTGLKWVVGQTYRVTAADAERIVKAVPQDSWECSEVEGGQPSVPSEPEVAPVPEKTPGF